MFDRDPGYDPRTDPIVRVQAVRLRSKLIEYYASSGAGDETVIELPSRGYVPQFRFRTRPQPAEPPLPSIAVLPFADMSPEANLQYFCDGIAEQILHILAQNPNLKVVARTSSFAYRGKAENVRAIGEALGASSILEGSVRLSGSRTRVTAQLLNARDGFHLWSETFERELADIFAIQDDIAAAISRKLDPGAPPPANGASTRLEVYDAVLLGRHYFAQQTPSGFEKALAAFEEAGAKDPAYAPASTGIALTLLFQAFFGIARPLDVLSRATSAARRAVQLEPGSAQAHLALGAVLSVLEFRLRDGLAEYEHSAALDPSLSDAHDFMAMAFTCLGREREAIESVQRARQLDPLAVRIEENLGFTFFQFRRYAESTAVYRAIIERSPQYPLARLGLAWNALMQNDPAAALEQLARAREFVGDWPFLLGTRGFALARNGNQEEAFRLLDSNGPLRSPSMAYEGALVATALGDRQLALDLLEQAAAERTGFVLFLGVNPLLDPLRSEPRFEALRRHLLGEG